MRPARVILAERSRGRAFLKRRRDLIITSAGQNRPTSGKCCVKFLGAQLHLGSAIGAPGPRPDLLSRCNGQTTSGAESRNDLSSRRLRPTGQTFLFGRVLPNCTKGKKRAADQRLESSARA